MFEKIANILGLRTGQDEEEQEKNTNKNNIRRGTGEEGSTNQHTTTMCFHQLFASQDFERI